MAVNVFVMIEMFYLFNCRSLKKSMFAIGLVTNRWLLGGVAFMFVLQLLFTYLPVMNYFFHSAPIPAAAWIGIVGAGLATYLVVGAEKWVRNRAAPMLPIIA